MQLKLIVSNKPSHLNKKLIKFFEINLLSLNKASITFDFEVAHPKDIEKYTNKGITNYPVLISNNSNIVGVEKIIEYLKNAVNKHNVKVTSKSDKERLDDFWKQTLGKIEKDDGGNIKPEKDDSEDNENLQHKIQAAFEQRNASTAKPGKFKSSQAMTQSMVQQSHVSNNESKKSNDDQNTVNIIANMKKNGTATMDDDLMSRFFENQEESV